MGLTLKTNIQVMKNNKINIYLILLIILISIYLFSDFLLCKKLYIFTDFGNDTLYSGLSNYSYLINKIKSGDLRFWSFEDGLGNSRFARTETTYDPFNVLFLFFNKNNLAYAFGYVAVLKILLAGIFFYFYISKLNVSNYAKIIGSLLYAFNGYIVLYGTAEFQNVSMMVFLPLIMYSFECLLIDYKWVPFCLSIAFINIFSIYFSYQITIYLIIYSIFRYITLNTFIIKNIILFYLKFILYYLLGIGISSFIFLPTLYIHINNKRIVLDLSNIISNIINFKFYHIDYYISLIYRFFSSNLILFGDLTDPNNWQRHDAHPIVYSSLISLILLPQIFQFLNKKDKIIYFITSSIFLSLLLFPFFSIMFNGFNADYKRWTFIIIIFIIFLIVQTINFIDRSKYINIRLLIITILSLLLILLITIFYHKFKFNISEIIYNQNIYQYKIIFIFILFYFILFYLFKYNKIIKYLKIILIFSIGIELIVFSNKIINHRENLKPVYLKQKIGYFDYSNDAISYLKTIDNSFYRIDKSYYSVFLSDSLMQDYKGLQYYDSLPNPNYVDFIQNVEGHFMMGTWVAGFGGFGYRHNLKTLVGVKYFLAKKSNSIPYGYEHIKSFGDVYIYKNKYFLPLGFTYDKFIYFKDYVNLEKYQKDEILLKGFVYDEKNNKINNYENIIKNINNYLKPIEENISYDYIINKKLIDSGNKYENIIDINLKINPDSHYNKNSNLSLSIILKSPKDTIGQIYWKTKTQDFCEENSGKIEINTGEQTCNFNKNYRINLNPSEILGFRLVIEGGKDDWLTIKNISINSRTIENLKPYFDDIYKLKQNVLNIKTYTNSYILGDISLDKSKLLFLSIPYDKGWHAIVDGNEMPTEKVNVGFTGIFLEKGYHKIELKYMPPLMIAGIVVSLLSIIICFVHFKISNRINQ
jgi:uncharacterized membrane protein YfhO